MIPSRTGSNPILGEFKAGEGVAEMSGMRVLRSTVCRIAASFLILLCAGRPASSSTGGIPDDLKLDRAPEAEITTEPIPNPHASFPCVRCHTGKEASYELAKKFGIRMPLITEGESAILLCDRCHKDYHGFHPVNFPVKRLAEAVVRSGIFPLEVPVEGYNKITCTTCHAVHFPHTGNRLLRGFAVDPKTGGGAFQTRLDFCRACHGDEVKTLSGHAGTAGDQGCGLCHLPRDISGKIGEFKRRLNGTCALCHPLPAGKPVHFYDYNPFPEFKREELAGYGVLLHQGRFTCAACHQHHRESAEAPSLKPSFVAVVSKSVRIDPHRTTRFCQNCHPIAPPPPGTPGAVAPLLEADVTRLCRGCHAREVALQMHHPLAAPTERVAVPAGWPLRKDGTLGCQTCHLAGHAPQDPANPKWLRGGPYRQRNAICFRCHREEEYRGRDVHREVAAFHGCEICHVVKERSVVRPEGKVGDLLAEPNLLCLLCHSPIAHPASANHTVKPQDRSFLLIDVKKAPLTGGKITCHSCHDSHGGNIGTMLLRTAGSGKICANCHPF